MLAGASRGTLGHVSPEPQSSWDFVTFSQEGVETQKQPEPWKSIAEIMRRSQTCLMSSLPRWRRQSLGWPGRGGSHVGGKQTLIQVHFLPQALRSCRVLSESHSPDELLQPQLETGVPALAPRAVLRTMRSRRCESARGTPSTCCRVLLCVAHRVPLVAGICTWLLGLANPVFFTIRLWAPQVCVESRGGTRHCSEGCRQSGGCQESRVSGVLRSGGGTGILSKDR